MRAVVWAECVVCSAAEQSYKCRSSVWVPLSLDIICVRLLHGQLMKRASNSDCQLDSACLQVLKGFSLHKRVAQLSLSDSRLFLQSRKRASTY